MNQFQKVIQNQNKYSEYLSVVNSRLGLTDRQLQVLSILVQIDAECPLVYGRRNILTKEYRQQIIDKSGIGYCNLSNFTTLFKDKGILIKHNGGWVIANQYKPYFEDNKCDIVFTLTIE